MWITFVTNAVKPVCSGFLLLNKVPILTILGVFKYGTLRNITSCAAAHLAAVLPPRTNARTRLRTLLCCSLFFFLTFLHKPVPQDSASSRILCPCITSCDDLASSAERDYEVLHETGGRLKKSMKGVTAGSMRFVLCCTCENLPDAPRLELRCWLSRTSHVV